MKILFCLCSESLLLPLCLGITLDLALLGRMSGWGMKRTKKMSRMRSDDHLLFCLCWESLLLHLCVGIATIAEEDEEQETIKTTRGVVRLPKQNDDQDDGDNQ